MSFDEKETHTILKALEDYRQALLYFNKPRAEEVKQLMQKVANDGLA